MEPRWVNICEREPELDKEVQVLVVKLGIEIGCEGQGNRSRLGFSD
jgi:hypothetical protein